MESIFDEKKIIIRFEGQTHQVDVNTLTSSLLVFSESLKEINKDIGSGKSIEIKIEALHPGSFEIHTIVNAVAENNLLTAIAQIGGVASTIGLAYQGVVRLRSWLKKEKKEIEVVEIGGDKTTIKTKSGDVFICSNVVYNIYNTNQIVNDHISDQFRILEEDPAIEGLTIASDGEVVNISKEDFSGLAEKIDVTDHNKKKEIKERQKVIVVKPVLENSTTRRWEFIWNGNKISANITDVAFLERMEQGEYRFGTGDTMVVDLQINQVLNPVYDAWVNESYQIALVRDHFPKTRFKPTSLFGDQADADFESK